MVGVFGQLLQWVQLLLRALVGKGRGHWVYGRRIGLAIGDLRLRELGNVPPQWDPGGPVGRSRCGTGAADAFC